MTSLITTQQSRRYFLMASLIVSNFIVVSSLYWAQSVVAQVRLELENPAYAVFAPGGTLLGYALGVTALATLSDDLSRPRGLAFHGAFLSAALCLAAASPDSVWLDIACIAIGLGCAVTQRHLVIATTFVTEAQRPQAIGTIISSGLLGIVFARALVTETAYAIGWRQLFLADAIAALCVCLLTASLSPRHIITPPSGTKLPSPLVLFRSNPELRGAALHQAVAFAIFNLAWAVFPLITAARPLDRASIAGTGAIAALASGRACRKLLPSNVAAFGLVFVVAAAALGILTLLFLTRTSGATIFCVMVLLEVGTQVALVANQARAQAAASSTSLRGRLAAIVTTVAFVGGAIGAAIGNFISQ